MASHREHQGSISSSVPPALTPGSPCCVVPLGLPLFLSRAFGNYATRTLFRGLFLRASARTRIKVYHATPAEPRRDDSLETRLSLRIRDVI